MATQTVVKKAVQLFKFDSNGNKELGPLVTEDNKDIWPYAFQTKIARVLRYYNVGDGVKFNRWWYGDVCAITETL